VQDALERGATIQAASRKADKKQAVQVLEDFMLLCAGMAAYFQPRPPTAAEQNPNADEGKFLDYMERACDYAIGLARYQSPSFKAVLATILTPGQPAMAVGGELPQLPVPETHRQSANAQGEGAKVIDLRPDEAELARVYQRIVGATRVA
jgi:hypothetical protein